MNDLTVGRVIRILRQRRGWRQQDVADRAGVSQATVSLLERGVIECSPLRTVRAVLDVLDAHAWIDMRWRGGIIDRLLDERHAALTGAVAGALASWDWEVVPELSYSEFGERGALDLAAWHAASRTMLVVEVKTELVSVESTLRKLDEKVRLGPRIVRQRLGWEPAIVGRLLVLPSDRTQRRQVDRHAAVFGRAFELRGRAVRARLRNPAGSGTAFSGLWLMATTTRRSTATPLRGDRTSPTARRSSRPLERDVRRIETDTSRVGTGRRLRAESCRALGDSSPPSVGHG